MIRKTMALMAALFLISPAIAFAVDFCAADNNGDCKVDLTDLVTMKSKFLKPDCEACSPPYPAPVAKTGQTNSYGVAWPNPRFTNNGDGTVKDNLTGLTWMKDAYCFGQRTWDQALSACNGLASGSCGLTDESIAGDWRLPNFFESASLVDFHCWDPAISNAAGTGCSTPGDPFTNVQYTNWHGY